MILVLQLSVRDFALVGVAIELTIVLFFEDTIVTYILKALVHPASTASIVLFAAV